MAVLETDKLGKAFGAMQVLNDIDLAVEEGEFLVLVGPSGCGKSTLLNMIAGLEAPTSGMLSIDGRDMIGVAPKDRNIAMVFQSYALYPNMSVASNITFGMKVRGVSRKEREDALHRVAKLLQIEEQLNRRPSQLSGGQRQRVAMGRALVREPRLFLFDEPLSNLDAKLRVEMRAEIKKLYQRLGTTIVYVTHDQIEAMNLATRVAVMHEGDIVQIGHPQAVYDRPATAFVASFIGSPGMNLVPGRLESTGADTVCVCGEGGAVQRLPVGHYPFAAQPTDGQPVWFGLRPEAVRANPDGDAGPKELPSEVTPTLVESNGHDVHALFPFAGTEITGRFGPHDGARRQRALPVAFDLNVISLFDYESGRRL